MIASNIAFWLFLAVCVVASLTFITIVVWAENRRKEREEFYRFEFRKRLVEAGKMDASTVAALAKYEHDLQLRQGREKLAVGGIVTLGVGAGSCLGLSFLSSSVWMLGLLPLTLGLCMLGYALLVGKPSLDPPPAGWSPDTSPQG